MKLIKAEFGPERIIRGRIPKTFAGTGNLDDLPLPPTPTPSLCLLSASSVSSSSIRRISRSKKTEGGEESLLRFSESAANTSWIHTIG
ncbi:hypothetical protein SLA2020_090990 [Shorea laevis]